MKRTTRIMLLAIAALVIAPFSSAVANGQSNHHKKVVRDGRGHVVKNTWNNCVVTKWNSNTDECNGTKPTKPMRFDSELLTVYFAFNRSEITPAGRAKLDTLVDMIRKSGRIENVSIVGFADKIGASDYNHRLSEQRADAVKQYLQKDGVDTRDISVRGLGESNVSECSGIDGQELKACLWRDRRVELKLNYFVK